jgi:G3E family GTPase
MADGFIVFVWWAVQTTLLLSCISQLRAAHGNDYRICWLKNEYGTVAVDSQLAAQQNISGVKELLAGCICCTQVGKLADALQELQTQYHPDRIFIETSGSSLPAPLAREINRLSSENIVPVELDAIICVIDAVNFKGYADKSTTAKIQAKFTNLILINKHEVSSTTFSAWWDRASRSPHPAHSCCL